MKLSYPDFFHAAAGNRPYDWQCRLAEDPSSIGEIRLTSLCLDH